MSQQDQLARGLVPDQQADNADFRCGAHTADVREAVAELREITGVDSDRARHELTSETRDAHLEAAGCCIDTVGDYRTVVAPVGQDDSLDGDGLRVRGSAGGTADGNMLTRDDGAGVEKVLRQRIMHPVNEVVLIPGEIDGGDLAEGESGGGG